MPFTEVATNVHVYYEQFGSGAPLLFVNAGLGTHNEWDNQVAGLAAHFRTVTFDWRGTGRSDAPSGPYTLDGLVSDIRQLVDELGTGPCTVVAHGIGAHAALVFAERHPASVSGLFLVGAGPWYSGDRDGTAGGFSSEFLDWWGSQTASRGVASVDAYAALARDYLFHSPPSGFVVQWFVDGATQWPLYVLNSYCADFAEVDHVVRASAISCPVLIAQGRHDRKQRYEGAAVLASLLPNAHVHTFDESAHMPHIEQMAEFNTSLAEFVLKIAVANDPTNGLTTARDEVPLFDQTLSVVED